MKKLSVAAAAIALPLAAVAIYFVLFEPPASPTGPGGPPAPGGAGLPADHPPIAGGAAGAPEQHPQVGETGRAVRVPAEVKGAWRAVKLKVERREGGTPAQLVTVPLGQGLEIPGSALRIQVGEFLPALQVQNAEVTSAGNAPTNPAAHVTVQEGGRELFKGWLFANFPEMRPFEHPVYRITLLGGVPAK